MCNHHQNFLGLEYKTYNCRHIKCCPKKLTGSAGSKEKLRIILLSTVTASAIAKRDPVDCKKMCRDQEVGCC